MTPRENPHQIVLQRIWMLYLCWDAERRQVSPSPPLQNTPKKSTQTPSCHPLWVGTLSSCSTPESGQQQMIWWGGNEYRDSQFF